MIKKNSLKVHCLFKDSKTQCIPNYLEQMWMAIYGFVQRLAAIHQKKNVD